MRKIIEEQMKVGEIDISNVKLNEKSRDDMDKILLGIQYLYKNDQTRKKLFDILKTLTPVEIDKKNGRPGVDLWNIFVLAMVRMAINCDLDRLLNLCNNHISLRGIMGHQKDDETFYVLETLRRNLKLFTPEILDKISNIAVDAGHQIVKKKS